MRPERLNPLFADVSALPKVGPAAKRALERLDLLRVRDLLFHFPVGWRHTRYLDSLSQGLEGERVMVDVRIVAHEPVRGRGPLRILAEDRYAQSLTLAFFGPRGSGLAGRFPEGTTVRVAGKLEIWNNRYQMVHPELVAGPGQGSGQGPAQGPGQTGDLAEPVYPLTHGLTSKRMAAWVEAAAERIPDLPEWIEPSLLAKRGWPSHKQALADVHGQTESRLARDRLAYDEMLASQLAWALVRAKRRRKRGQPLQGNRRLTDPLLASLPFRLTGAQSQAIAEIAADMATPHAMLRLLQGDVGAGKTLVALMSLLIAVEGGAQGALLAPTDLLARQHYAGLQKLTAGLPVKLGFLSGREKGKARAAVLADLASGEIDILVGTHALFQADVVYRNLGFAVIDEQHKFGVAQRLMLTEKAEVPPHLLVMTATPIPRTLALANFGEMDISKLGERPPGRQPIDTRVIALSRLDEVLAGLERHLTTGRQVYWVCPLLEAGEADGEGAQGDREGAAPSGEGNPLAGMVPAMARADMLKKRFGDKVALVHGKMPGAERDREMARFQNREAMVLVATTVIEVGVDVPNATLMVIENAERFGLAQLHQLRGRVGRGSDSSVCLLLRAENLSKTATERLKMMRATDDGFAIAEADLKLRGAGELLGTRQSGDEAFQIATPEQVDSLLPIAHDDARLLTASDGGLEGARGEAARLLLYLFEKDTAVATLRGG